MRNLFSSLLLLIPITVFAGSPVVRNTGNGVELQNNHVSIVLSNSAELVSCIDLETGVDIAEHSKNKIARIKTTSGVALEASRIVLAGDVMTITIGQYKVKLMIQAFDDFFTAEVLNQSLPGAEELVFLDLKFKYDFKDKNAFVAADVAMTLQTDPVFFPSGENKSIRGRCTAKTGFNGAKLAFVVSKKTGLRACLQMVYEALSPGTVPFTRAGGSFALDNEINKDDCVIISGDREIGDINELIKFYSGLGIRQFDFHKGSKTFLSGQFSFPVYGSAAAFKQQVTDPLRKAGILSILHTYAYYIDYGAKELLSNPKWQQQLEYRETFTLSKDLTETATQISVREDASGLRKDATYWSVHTPYLLIDEEIIKYTLDQSGFATCQRGMCGTTAMKHKSGAIIKVISGKFSCIAPQIGSELYYEVARRTAKAYNEGGFGGIYFDAYDGLETHLKKADLDGYLWYYGASFINEVLKYCEGTPIIEYSNQHPTVWAARGRCGAWDYPVRGYKNFIDDHLLYNKDYMNRHYVTTLGWYNFYPVGKNEPLNYATKYMFSDDVDYLGVKAVAYNQTMVYNGLKEIDVETIPAMRRNLDRYAQYNKLRKDGYFSDRVLEVLKQGKYEYSLGRKSGHWGFNEVTYVRRKLRDIKDDCLSGNNPFKRQKPFLRLENMYSSNGTSPVLLMKFNDALELKSQRLEKSFAAPIDISKHLGIKVRVKGNGQESKDAICIRLSQIPTGSGTGVGDYIVKLDFEGWRDVVLTSIDNAEYGGMKFKGMDDPLYNVHRYPINFSKIKSIKLFLAGECDDVRVGSIEAVPLVENALSNPIVRIGNSSVTFKDVIKSGEYIEYASGAKTALVYDSIGNSRTINVKRKGRLRVPYGAFSVIVDGDPELPETPAVVTLTIGLYGDFIFN